MYVKNYTEYSRNKTHKVFIGDIPMGSKEPVRLQSMTNTDTNDVEATAEQIMQIAKAGADYVRITVQTSKVAESLPKIKALLQQQNCKVPLIADIHFSPKAAEKAAKIVDKVRINPGNYADVKQFKHIEYSDEEYAAEVAKLRTNFVPLLKICKAHNTAIRIGTNHGSLSDRILSRYGDTPKGMVEATMEFLRICKAENFQDVVISMKSSNPSVMIFANRFLVLQMHKEGMSFPIHLGVTEAGNELEGRIKSALGIGSLLADGIGDTIRVSLTESPEKEIPVAEKLVAVFKTEKQAKNKFAIKEPTRRFLEYKRRKSLPILNIGGEHVPIVISDISEKQNAEGIAESGFIFNHKKQNFEKTDLAADYLFVKDAKQINPVPELVNILSQETEGIVLNKHKKAQSKEAATAHFIEINAKDIGKEAFKDLKQAKNTVFILNLSSCAFPVQAGRAFFLQLEEHGIHNPVVLKLLFPEINEPAVLKSSAEIGALLIDGFGDGIMISGGKNAIAKANELSFGILQACRTRISKNEYISCPSCGRTLFNLEKTTAIIKEKTAHLKGVKIAVMGCIVNGPGEMADADYGYVGTGTGKVTLYKNKEVVQRNIPENEAPDKLLKLIEQYS